MENLILPSLGKAGSEPMLEPGSNFTLDMSPASLEALDPTHEDEGYLTTANDDENCPSSHLASSIPLTQNEIDGFRPEIHGSKWNYDLQRFLALPESVTKYARLRSVCEGFLDTATVAGRQILMEFNRAVFNEMDAILESPLYKKFSNPKERANLAPSELREAEILQARYERLDSRFSIKRAPVGGKAGGFKFIYQGILFKLASNKVDPTKSTGIYPNEEHAMKSVNNELKALRCLESADPRGFSLPLCAAIHYNGHVLLAEALLPIDHTTLVLGSDNGGRTVKSDPKHTAFREAVNAVAARYNLHPFYTRHLGTGRPLLHYFPLDVEGHCGYDNKNYLVDLARLMPPERMKNLYSRLLRPAFLLSESSDLKFYSDTYSDKWMLKYTDADGQPFSRDFIEQLKVRHEQAVLRISELIKLGEFLKEPPKFFPNQKIFDSSHEGNYNSKGGQSMLPESDALRYKRYNPVPVAGDNERFEIVIFNLHAIGLSCHHLGHVLEHLTQSLKDLTNSPRRNIPSSRLRNLEETRDLVGVECMARTFKNIIRAALRIAKESPENILWSKSVIQRTIVGEFSRFLLQKQDAWERFVSQVELRFEGFKASGFSFGWEVKEDDFDYNDLVESADHHKGDYMSQRRETNAARIWRMFMRRLSALTRISFTKRIESDHKVVRWIDESDVLEIGVKSSTMLLLHKSNAKYYIHKFLEAFNYLRPDLDAAFSHVGRALDLLKEWRLAAPFDAIEPIYWTAISSLFLRQPPKAPELENILTPVHKVLLAKWNDVPHAAVTFRDPDDSYVKKVECLRTLIELSTEVWDPVLIAEPKEWTRIRVSSSSNGVLDLALPHSHFDPDTAILYCAHVFFHPEEFSSIKWGWWCYVASSLHSLGQPPALTQERAIMLLELFCKFSPSMYKELVKKYPQRLDTLLEFLCIRAFRIVGDEGAAEAFHTLYSKHLKAHGRKLPATYDPKSSFDSLFAGSSKFAEASFRTLFLSSVLKDDPECASSMKFLKAIWTRERYTAKFLERTKGGENLPQAQALIKAKMKDLLKNMPHWVKALQV